MVHLRYSTLKFIIVNLMRRAGKNFINRESVEKLEMRSFLQFPPEADPPLAGASAHRSGR